MTNITENVQVSFYRASKKDIIILAEFMNKLKSFVNVAKSNEIIKELPEEEHNKYNFTRDKEKINTFRYTGKEDMIYLYNLLTKLGLFATSTFGDDISDYCCDNWKDVCNRVHLERITPNNED